MTDSREVERQITDRGEGKESEETVENVRNMGSGGEWTRPTSTQNENGNYTTNTLSVLSMTNTEVDQAAVNERESSANVQHTATNGVIGTTHVMSNTLTSTSTSALSSAQATNRTCEQLQRLGVEHSGNLIQIVHQVQPDALLLDSSTSRFGIDPGLMNDSLREALEYYLSFVSNFDFPYQLHFSPTTRNRSNSTTAGSENVEETRDSGEIPMSTMRRDGNELMSDASATSIHSNRSVSNSVEGKMEVLRVAEDVSPTRVEENANYNRDQ